MAQLNYKDWGKNALKVLKEKGLIEALQLVGAILKDEKGAPFASRYDDISITFKYLLSYLARGMKDPQREEMANGIRARLVDLIADIDRSLNIQYSTEAFYNVARTVEYSRRTLDDVISEYLKYSSLYAIMCESETPDTALMKQRERALDDLFEWVWTASSLSGEDRDKLLRLAYETSDSATLRATIINACMLSLLRQYNSSRMLMLLDMYSRADNDETAARALIAIILVLNKYGEVTVYSSEVRRRLESWQDSLLSYSRLRDVEMALISAFDTDRVSKDFSTNVMPEMMKLQPQIRKMMQQMQQDLKGKDPEEIREQIESVGFNPEWEKLMADSGLEEKMRRMNDMLTEGNDLMYASFKNMKTAPFFRRPNNWLIPYESYRSELPADLLHIFQIAPRVKTHIMCDSDLYSLSFTIANMPAGMAAQMQQGMSAELNAMAEQSKDDFKTENTSFSIAAKRFAKDCYRFFTLFPGREAFGKPFSRPVAPDRLPIIGDTLFDSEFKRLVYEFFFRAGYYRLALDYLEPLAKSKDADYTIYQKTGYCHQMLGNYREALDYYLRAQLFDTQEIWIHTAIGNTYMKLHEYRNAAHSFESALKLTPDDKAILLQAGYARLAEGDCDIALTHLYKVDYMEPGIESARSIAWGEFLRNDAFKALEYSQKIIAGEYASEPSTQDYIRAGHIYMALGNLTEAIRMYQTPKDVSKRDLLADLPALEKSGVSISDFRLLVDYVLWKDRLPLLSDTSTGRL